MRLIRTALLENQPTAGLRFTLTIFPTRRVVVFWIAIKSLPRYKLSSCSIEDDVTRNSEFNLLAIYPSSRRRRNLWRQSHLVPKFVCLLGFIRLITLPVIRSGARLSATSFWRHVCLNRLGRFRLRHALPTDDIERRSAIESHHDVVVAT